MKLRFATAACLSVFLLVGSHDAMAQSASSAVVSHRFNIKQVPISNKEIGDFPYFKFPTGLKAQNVPYQRIDDQIYVPIDGIMQPFEGTVWRSFVVKDGLDWSLFSFNKSITQWIVANGGVPVYEGKVSKNELDRVKKDATYFGDEGSIDYWNNKVRVYVIRRSGGNCIFIQFAGNSASGAIQIVETKLE